MSASNVGSVVEFSPATREARVRFPDVAIFCRNVPPHTFVHSYFWQICTRYCKYANYLRGNRLYRCSVTSLLEICQDEFTSSSGHLEAHLAA